MITTINSKEGATPPLHIGGETNPPAFTADDLANLSQEALLTLFNTRSVQQHQTIKTAHQQSLSDLQNKHAQSFAQRVTEDFTTINQQQTFKKLEKMTVPRWTTGKRDLDDWDAFCEDAITTARKKNFTNLQALDMVRTMMDERKLIDYNATTI